MNMVCDECEGSTKAFSARDRATASKEVRQAIADQSRMLGLYAPEKFAWTDSRGEDLDFIDELRAMDIEDLDRELEIYQLGAREERKRQKRVADREAEQRTEPEREEDRV